MAWQNPLSRWSALFCAAFRSRFRYFPVFLRAVMASLALLLFSCPLVISCFYIEIRGSSRGNTWRFTSTYREVRFPVQGSALGRTGRCAGFLWKAVRPVEKCAWKFTRSSSLMNGFAPYREVLRCALDTRSLRTGKFTPKLLIFAWVVRGGAPRRTTCTRKFTGSERAVVLRTHMRGALAVRGSSNRSVLADRVAKRT